MASLNLAANTVVGTPDMGHLQIVYIDDFGVETEIEVQADSSILLGYWQFALPGDHTLGANYEVAGKYQIVEIDLGTRDVEEVWDSLVALNGQFVTEFPEITYDVFKNSNSYVSTLLACVGIDVDDYTGDLYDVDIASFPGGGLNILYSSTDSIELTVTGTSGDDSLQGGWKDDVVYGGDGDDFLTDGGDGNDILVGGNDFDTYQLNNLPSDTVYKTIPVWDNVNFVFHSDMGVAKFDVADTIIDSDGEGKIEAYLYSQMFESSVLMPGTDQYSDYFDFSGTTLVEDARTSFGAPVVYDNFSSVYSAKIGDVQWYDDFANYTSGEMYLCGALDGGDLYLWVEMDAQMYDWLDTPTDYVPADYSAICKIESFSSGDLGLFLA